MIRQTDEPEEVEAPAEKTCFVVSPIGAPDSPVRQRSDQVFDHIIGPAAEANGLVAIRGDRISAPGLITSQLIQHILEDAIVVADLTDYNSNVFYEIGIRHTVRKPIVHIAAEGTDLPFDVMGYRTVPYVLSLKGAVTAKGAVARQIAASLAPGFNPVSPVSIAETLSEITRTAGPKTETLMQAVTEQISDVTKAIAELKTNVWRSDELKQIVPAYVRDCMEDMLQRYAREIELLQSVRAAGIIGVFKRREAALKAFEQFIDEEANEITIVGSSLKGLLQNTENKQIAERLRFKQELGVRVRYLLTHPIVADLRASQERRRLTEIGVEILKSLKELSDWKTKPENVRLYLGTPTCFAIKTSRQMLINPYPYMSVSYDSPCLLLAHSREGAGAGSPSYMFDEFTARHFGAWETDLSVPIHDFNRTIEQCAQALGSYAHVVGELIDHGKQVT